MRTDSRHFKALTREALANETLQASLDGVRKIMPEVREAAIRNRPDFDALCTRATAIRNEAIVRLDHYTSEFEQLVTARGGQVHHAATGADACRIVADICRSVDARRVTKSKSMVTEEIELAAALEGDGLDVTETDLGEYIIQLRGEKPSHILAPALHVSLEEVAATFEANHALDRPAPLSDPADMLAEARYVMRDKFLNADVGITGANFLVAETGSTVIVTNEGNAELTACLPDTHIVVTGMEKLVPTLDDVGVLLRVLARSAIGERLSNYTTFFQGPRGAEETSGPSEFHVILVDNGRSELRGTEFEDMLRCIRCSACLNHCPVYTSIGGHAYGSVYSGPMGAILTPALAGLPAASHLPNASTFCGRCEVVCPVNIPLPKLLRHWREREFARRIAPAGQRVGLALWRLVNRWPALYRTTLAAAAALMRLGAGESAGGRRWIRKLPFPGGAWTRTRDMPAPAAASFQSQWKGRRR
jgi:L-lactate dehydrogenase complex protein LldF